jgi:U3 small nucleolar RNA-associated protein 19
LTNVKICPFQNTHDAVVFQAIKSGQRLFNHFLSSKCITYTGAMTSKGVHVAAKTSNKQTDEESTAALTADPQYQIHLWIRKRYFEFCSTLVELLCHDEPGLQLPALSALMDFERFAGQSLTDKLPIFANVFFPWVVAVLVHRRGDNDELLAEFREKYLNLFDDVRYHLFVNCTTLIHSYDPSTRRYFVKNPCDDLKITKRMPYLTNEDAFNESIFEIMIELHMASKPSHLNRFLVQLNPNLDEKDKKSNKKKRKRESTPAEEWDSDEDLDSMMLDELSEDDDDDDDDVPQVHAKLLDLSSHKSIFSKAWLALMAKKLDSKLHMRILLALEKQIIPFMVTPVTLFDYLCHCYSGGGVLGMLSLGGLFILLRKYNVEYQDFFPHLYSMFTPSTFYIKQRKRFFELSSLFLEGANLPLYMLCAFVKRFSRLTLTASPQGCLIMISMVYRILLKHPAAQVLLHRVINFDPSSETTLSTEPKPLFPLLLQNRLKPLAEDPFDMEEKDPSKCRAIESSLWEMKVLMNHAVPAVATLAQLLFGSNELKALDINVNDFIEQSYQSLFETEYKRKTKNSALNFQIPKFLFDKEIFSSYSIKSEENLMAYHDSQLVSHSGGPTSSALYAEKKKRKSFAELKTDRKKKQLSGSKRPRFAMR